MHPYLTGVFGNPSSHHTAGESAASALEDARARVARVLGMRTNDVIFTAGGTEANNLAVKGIVLAALSRGRRHLITTPIEHESILESARYLERFHAVSVTMLPVDGFGRVSAESFATALRDDTALVSLGHANNEIGTVQDAAGLAALAKNAGVPLHLDAVQSAGWLPLTDLGADAISIAGHKVGAPKGIGALAVRGRVPLEPLLHGGGQERGVRSGTLDVPSVRAFAVALAEAVESRPQRAAHLAALRDTLVAGVRRVAPEAVLRGPDPSRFVDGVPARLPANAHFTFPGAEGDSLLYLLDSAGVQASTGSACQAGVPQPSHVLLAMGVPELDARGALRFSLGTTSQAADVDRLVAVLPQVVDRAQAAGLVSGRALTGGVA